MEKVEEKSLSSVFDDAYLHPEIAVEQCNSNITLYFDCNTCSCYQNTYLCTSRFCYDDKPVLRLGKAVKEKLPELMSQRSICMPGLKHKYKCNTCVCNRKGRAICTSMICLSEVVVNADHLRNAIASYWKNGLLTTLVLICGRNKITSIKHYVWKKQFTIFYYLTPLLDT